MIWYGMCGMRRTSDVVTRWILPWSFVSCVNSETFNQVSALRVLIPPQGNPYRDPYPCHFNVPRCKTFDVYIYIYMYMFIWKGESVSRLKRFCRIDQRMDSDRQKDVYIDQRYFMELIEPCTVIVMHCARTPSHTCSRRMGQEEHTVTGEVSTFYLYFVEDAGTSRDGQATNRPKWNR